ncbi:MAG TPA: hypothetical protein VL123_01245 [Candidatus Udaeobacter sp.]|jgi:hypothetical protein|nr:hypothetical protein [Candidatus Udaeobacter sp.]
MKRFRAGSIAALCGILVPAACALAQTAGPFPVVNVPPTRHESHRLANVSMVSGVALIAASFAFERTADRSYDEYLAASDPARITDLYDRTTRFDRLSSASLVTGNVLLATGLTLRFIRHSHGSSVGVLLDSRRCALALNF